MNLYAIENNKVSGSFLHNCLSFLLVTSKIKKQTRIVIYQKSCYDDYITQAKKFLHGKERNRLNLKHCFPLLASCIKLFYNGHFYLLICQGKPILRKVLQGVRYSRDFFCHLETTRLQVSV